MPNNSVSSPAMQAGRTLIELVIAMAIGLVIVIGVSSLYLSSSGISRTANQLSTTEQAGQLALLMIGDSLKRAAFGEIIGSDYAAQGQTLMAGPHLGGCTNSQFTNPFPTYVMPPAPQTPPNLGCTVASPLGDTLYVRYQAAPVIAQMLPANAAAISLFDCTASQGSQNEVLFSQQMRAGAGLERPMVTNVFQRDPAANTLNCKGYSAGPFEVLLQNVLEFKVFYRFDAAAHAVASSGETNAAPFGGTILDATGINALAGVVDPWNYVVAVMVCVTLETAEIGVSTSTTNATATRCPVDAAEAETGLSLVMTNTTGTIRRTFSQVFTVRNRATPSPSIL